MQTDNILCDISKGSALRFIKLLLSTNDTPYWFHQTLTFAERIEDFKEAKTKLNTFFDAFEKELKGKRIEIAIIYILGRQRNGGVHFHALFFCYPPQVRTAEAMEKELKRAAFRQWKRINEPFRVARAASALKRRSKSGALPYLLPNHFKVVRTNRERGKPHWYGVRNKRLILANSTPIAQESVKQVFCELFPSRIEAVQARPVAKKYYDKRELRDLRRYNELRGAYSWDDFKRRETRQTRLVSDDAFIYYLNNGTMPMPDVAPLVPPSSYDDGENPL